MDDVCSCASSNEWLKRVIGAFVAVLSLSFCATGFLRASDVTLHGRIVDENEAPVRDALVTVRLTASGADSWNAVTDATGIFSLTLPAPGSFRIGVSCAGYYTMKDRPLSLESNLELTLQINTVREVFQSENVNAETSPVDVEQAQNQQTLSGTEVNNMPFANSHSLRNALPLLPGVLEDANAVLHVNGSNENQVLYLLNGFNLTNPISGQFQTLLAVEGIRTLDLSSGRTSPEFGKGSAGVLAINTENGTDTLHYTATDFIPGLSLQQGLHLGNWYPRFGISGPILRGRAWFSDTFDMEYSQARLTGLPKGQNTRSGWLGSDLLHTQVNVTSANILFADFLVNLQNEGRVGLGPLSPVSTTTDQRSHEYFVSLKDQEYFGHGALLELGYAHQNVFQEETPQGPNLYVISPVSFSGNFFLNSQQAATRDQLLLQAFLPKFQFAGAHQIQLGTDADWLGYDGDFRRTGYQVLGLSGQLISETLFPTPAQFHVSDQEISLFALDTWRVSKQWQLTLGVRADRDQKIDSAAWSPRVAFSWSPFAAGHTRIAGGYSITHDDVTLQMLGLPLDQIAETTTYSATGAAMGPPTQTSFVIPKHGIVLPRASNWTLDGDHQLSSRIVVSAKYLRRRGTDGFAFLNTVDPNAPPSLLPLPSGELSGVYQLTNLRRDDYDSVSLSIHQKLSAQYEWMAAYTHSRATSNAVIDANSPQPLQTLASFVPMPWDAPNRLLAWGYFPLPWKKWAVSGLADMRTGFPFSVRDQSGLVIGAVDAYRYPLNFDLNLAIERMFTLRKYRFALRAGVDNLTNQANPSAVNNVTGTSQFLQFVGDEGRHYVLRIRFFGRAVNK